MTTRRKKLVLQLTQSVSNFHFRRGYTQARYARPAVLPQLMERAMGIEPTSEAWEASILPLNYARPRRRHSEE